MLGKDKLPSNYNRQPRIVVLGGGNGTSRLLLSLLPLLQQGHLSSLQALVHMADDGGSTGRLREQYGVPAIGDLTKCLMALSLLRGDVRGDEFLRALDYRFSSGDFRGHTLRNAFLTSLEKTSDLDSAIATMARILQVPKYAGVVPTTLTPVTQQAVVVIDGKSNLLGEGQYSISHQVNLQADPRWQPGDVMVKFAEGDVPLNPRAAVILRDATHIIIAPGHTYGTILPTLALPSLQAAVKQNKKRLLVVMSLLTTPNQTTHWTGEDFIKVYEQHLGVSVDVVIGNTGKLPLNLVAGQTFVTFSADNHHYELLQDELISQAEQISQAGDTVPRAIVVHDTAKLKNILEPVIVHSEKISNAV